ncbi:MULTISPECIES: hypothetical protein [unclassified Mesorhizobium]|uniref:hypothetical protein n=2 Tax=Mesorhizobium TaxID=68287 RepID=UPI000FD50046|nr:MULTISPECIES: hypothetical protein [unclassified Mesorhizobium]RUV90237.1 hypothetical protein EOA51_00525 [Mesorhizobium sp. M1A.F.Ca.IN.020.32.1.1]RWF81273.1 MAG: hypothetical protein EOQ35_14515 [Mesorhizobium sp.]TIN65411.1 MAG: hypothetical protein E5Y26_05380 [Mesorhizobium sp.]
MPRDGSGVYSYPANGDAVPNTPISSSAYNTRSADLLTDLNAARPITAGGTAATSAVGGNDNLNPAGANMASAATLNLATSTGTLINVTGTTTITALGTLAAGAERELVFQAALTLTHNATSLILPGGANIVTAAGDVARMRSLGGGNWRCMSYQRATVPPYGQSIVQPTLTLKQSAAPAPTAEGDIQWDTDDNVLVIGDGAGQQIFVPLPASVAAGDIFYATSAKVLTRLPKGTAGQVLQMNPGAAAPQWASVPFTKSYESGQINVSTNSSTSVAHGLGVQPKLFAAALVCTTNEFGYVVGDEVEINVNTNSSSGTSGGISMYVNGTANIGIRIGNAISIWDKNGGIFGITPGSWKLIVRAWA